ncbi:substrate-binding periplasmic protein [Salinisphaera aquimarina]|uniref:Substrate-binding periplasmic protein n=1 Tax=Salinisphaera aquimarina TaxID=2094031 RepID=A0ABV7ES06_9GAMM
MLKEKLTKALLCIVLAAGVLLQPLHAQPAESGTGQTDATPSRLDEVIDSGKLRVGVNPDFRPFSFVDESGKRVGVDIRIAQKLADALGVELEIVAPDNFADLIPMLTDDKVDVVIAGMSITFDRARQVNFTDPYFDTGTSMLMNIGHSAKLGIGNVKDADQLIEQLRSSGNESQLKIAVTEGKSPAAVAKRLFPDATITGYPTNEDAAEATFKGDANLMIHDEVFLKVWLQANESRARFRMVVLDPPIKPDFYGMATRKGDLEWLQLLNVFVHEMRANHQVESYLARFLPNMNTDQMFDRQPLRFDIEDME